MFLGNLYLFILRLGLIIIMFLFEKFMRLFKRFCLKCFCLFLMILLSDFKGCLLVFLIVLVLWLLLKSIFMVFCNIFFLLRIMIFGVLSFIKCFKCWLWLMIWWYNLFILLIVNFLLFSVIKGFKFGGNIGKIVSIIYLGLLLEFKKFFIIFKCLMSFFFFVLELVFFIFFFKFCNKVIKLIFFNKFLIVLLFICVIKFLFLYFCEIFWYCFLFKILYFIISLVSLLL